MCKKFGWVSFVSCFVNGGASYELWISKYINGGVKSISGGANFEKHFGNYVIGGAKSINGRAKIKNHLATLYFCQYSIKKNLFVQNHRKLPRGF